MGPMQAFFYIAKLAYRIMIRVAIFLVFMSLLDYLFQRRRYRESLMMTPRELREEYKLYEGDPLVKARLRRRYRELLQRRLARSVESADVVITNPVKLAVAIRYEASSMPAPIVVAKGKGELARHIKELAEKFNIPIVENPPLCQALYNSTEVGDQIPRELYDAVAEVLAFVYQKKAATAS
jgi:flagellar biosynthetic protein FlhB